VAVFLIENGADVNQQNSEGVSPLMFAIMWTPDPKFIDFLIKHKAKLEHKDISGNTPLSGAVAMGRKDVVKGLLNSGADPNEANSKGYTPVMIAVMTNKAEILTMLLGAGADITRPHPKGWTVFQLSQKNMTPAVREIINAYAPKKPVQKKKKQTIGFPNVQIVR
jgi:ankyrin repeat protein